jgi:hypothetical protein
MESSTSSKIDLSDWESITIDIEQWSILIRQLEDALSLMCLLQSAPVKPKIDESATPTPSSEPLIVSIHTIMEGGRGEKYRSPDASRWEPILAYHWHDGATYYPRLARMMAALFL